MSMKMFSFQIYKEQSKMFRQLQQNVKKESNN